MGAPKASNLYANAGPIPTYGFYDRRKFGMLRGRATFAAAATATLAGAVTLPANAKVIACQANVSTALVLATATRWGIGVTADPDCFLHGGTGTTVGTISKDPDVGSGIFPVFTNQIVGTTGTAAGSALTLSVFSGQTIQAIPANFLKPGDIIRMRGSGTLVQGGSSTFTLKVLSGTDIVIASAAPTVVSGDIFAFDCDMTITAVGATGKFYSAGRTYVGTSAVAAGAADISSAGFLGTTTLDTTAAFTPSVTGTFSASDSSTAIMNQFTIEVIRPILFRPTAATTIVITALSAAGVSAGTGTSGAIDYEILFEEIAGPTTA